MYFHFVPEALFIVSSSFLFCITLHMVANTSHVNSLAYLSQMLTRWAYSIPNGLSPAVIRHL